MSDDQDPPEEEVEPGPAWLATFADLMSLLMCFFVLLLSFSEMDIQKYRQIAGSMAMAFGVQKKERADEAPKGTSVIAREYSPGMTAPIEAIKHDFTPLEEQRQRDLLKDRIRKNQSRYFDALRSSLDTEIDSGQVQLMMINGEIVVRIRESESFQSGSSGLRPTIYPILDGIVGSLKEAKGQLVVGGHTDNVPISTSLFPSNWVLSAARAANVVHYLATTNKVDGKQIEMRAYGDTRPIQDNSTPENRAANRRVEIIVTPPTDLPAPSMDESLQNPDSEDME